MFCKKCRFPIESEDLFCRRCGVETPAGKDAKILVKQRLRRSRGDQKVAGVCGGVARYLHQDPKIVRALWAGASVLPPFPGLFAYGVCWAVIPKEIKKAKTPQPPRKIVETKSVPG